MYDVYIYLLFVIKLVKLTFPVSCHCYTCPHRSQASTK